MASVGRLMTWQSSTPAASGGGSTGPTLATAGAPIGVLLGEFVTILAMSLSGVHRADANAASHVFDLTHRLKMSGVYAAAIPTEMIDHHVVAYRTNRNLVGQPGGVGEPAKAVNVSVPIPADRALPLPAIVRRANAHPGPEVLRGGTVRSPARDAAVSAVPSLQPERMKDDLGSALETGGGGPSVRLSWYRHPRKIAIGDDHRNDTSHQAESAAWPTYEVVAP